VRLLHARPDHVGGAAEDAEGVLAVLTHANLSKIASQPPLFPSLWGHPAPGMTFFPMQDEVVHYAGQPVAMVVADSLERARHAATLVRISYRETPSKTTIDQGRDQASVPEKIFGGLLPGHMERGDADAGLAGAAVRIDETYRMAANHHNPIEPSATTAVWEDGLLTLYDATQGVTATQFTVGALLGMPPTKVRVGIALDRARFEYGDTDLPNTSAAVGSAGTSMVNSAVHTAATALRDQLVAMAVADQKSPLHGADPGAVVVRDGRMALRERPEVGETYGDLLGRGFLQEVEALGTWNPTGADTGYAPTTFGAQFAEVAVDADLGLVRVRRMVGAFAPGRVLNPRTARSQLMGGMLGGLGQALLEGNHMDARVGRWANRSLGDYLVPVNADAPDVDVELVEVHDDIVNPLGVKGVGEIGQVGAAAAIANAVFHATGRRVRELPITVEDLLLETA
jgi:CO/xanthine dehydrogenase Mo-binding subunit